MAGSIARLICHKMVWLIHAIFSFISSVMILRLRDDYRISLTQKCSEVDLIEAEPQSERDYSISLAEKCNEAEPTVEGDATELFRHFEGDCEEEEKTEVCLSFKFPTYKEFCQNTLKKCCTNYEVATASVEEESIPVREIMNSCENKDEICVDEETEQILGGKKGNVGTISQEKEQSVVDDESLFSDIESSRFDHVSPMMEGLFDSYVDGFLSDRDFELQWNMDSESESSHDDFEDEDGDIVVELNALEEQILQSPDELSSQFLSEKDFQETISNTTAAEDEEELESLWEHQDLIEQLKMEIKKVRATGLPTIMEESDSPKTFDDLRPWKIDEFKREDCIGELHKFYKSYRERMRKFDIMNYQKMYAIGFLQLKDPLGSISTKQPSPPTLKSLVAPNLWIFRNKIHGSDPRNKFIEELHGDLEMVYVGQMCLSWEFLHWQYEKALDLWDSDARRSHRYNAVAGEFQQFQVLMQRFIEDEPFQGPRVKNYVKSRCVFRNLLQVPVIKQDNMKDRRKARVKDMDEYVITSDTLLQIVEESIRIFWRFVQTDKDYSTAAANSHKKLHDEEDLKLLLEAKKNLHKKEKKLRNLLRSENCVLRKLRRCRDGDDSDQVLCFFSQVDMKLVSRVLNMSKITRDQLIWCHSKLDRISFHNRKIYVEPAFLLFPC